MTTSADSFGRRKIQRIIGTIPTADLPRAIFLFLRLALTETLLYSLPSWRSPGRGDGGLPERVPLSRGERLSATMSAAADAGTMKAVRSEPRCVDTWPVSHGTRAPPKPAPENTQATVVAAEQHRGGKGQDQREERRQPQTGDRGSN